jgi:cytoskeletal protein RodZ
VGAALLAARLESGVTLLDIQARTGISTADLEAIETANFSRFRAVEVALVVVNRYAHVLGLDADQLGAALERSWPATPLPPPPKTDTFQSPWADGYLPAEVDTRGQSFVQTSQIPALVGFGTPAAGSMQSPSDTAGFQVFDQTSSLSFDELTGVHGPVGFADTFPATRPRPPLLLRVAVWTLLFLVLVGSAGIGVAHFRPAWTAKLHLVRHSHTLSVATGTSPTTTTAPVAKSTVAKVTMQSTGPLAAAVTVPATSFSVLVDTSGPCWVQATVPTAFNPLFSETLPAGVSKVFPAADGLVTVQLGSTHASLAVEVNGKVLPTWTFIPTRAPFTVTFSTKSAAAVAAR